MNEFAELDYESPDFDLQYSKALNWIHYEVETSQLKLELVKWAASVNKTEIAESVPQNYISVEGSIAYLLNRGAKLPQKSINRLLEFLQKYTPDNSEPSVELENLPDTASGRAVIAYVNCYSWIDNAKTKVLNDNLSIHELPSFVRETIERFGLGKFAITKKLLKHYKQSLGEARSDAVTKSWVKPLGVIVDTLNLLSGNKAAVKAAAKHAHTRRMNSTVSTLDRKGEKAASNLKHKDEDVVLGIKSVNPTNIVGASAVVIYNTKNRHIDIYVTKQDQQLSIKGTKIENFDEKASQGKIVRKPENALQMWVKATTIKRLEILRDSIKGKPWALTGKINSNHIILKVL